MRYKFSIYNNIYNFEEKKYLFNSHSGAFIKIDDATESYLMNINENETADKHEHFGYFQSKGILVPEFLNEFGQFRIRGLCNRFDMKPEQLSFVIVTTTSCNFRCFYCYEEGVKTRSMSAETQHAVAEYIQNRTQVTQCKSLRITWFGGEPLLNANCVQTISDMLILHCNDNGIEYSANIISNGSLVTEETIELFERCKIKSIQITVDGDEELFCKYKEASQSSYLSTINAIKLLANKVRVNVRLNTDGNNYQQLKSVVKELIRTEPVCKSIYFYLAKIENANGITWGDFYKLKEDFFLFLYENELYSSIKICLPKAKYLACGLMQQNNAVIDVDGSLLRCEHYVGNENEVIGSVYKGNYFDNEFKFIDDCIPETCQKCSVYPICRQGCSQRRIDNKFQVECEKYKEMVKENLYYISKINF